MVNVVRASCVNDTTLRLQLIRIKNEKVCLDHNVSQDSRPKRMLWNICIIDIEEVIQFLFLF